MAPVVRAAGPEANGVYPAYPGAGGVPDIPDRARRPTRLPALRLHGHQSAHEQPRQRAKTPLNV